MLICLASSLLDVLRSWQFIALKCRLVRIWKSCLSFDPTAVQAKLMHRHPCLLHAVRLYQSPLKWSYCWFWWNSVCELDLCICYTLSTWFSFMLLVFQWVETSKDLSFGKCLVPNSFEAILNAWFPQSTSGSSQFDSVELMRNCRLDLFASVKQWFEQVENFCQSRPFMDRKCSFRFTHRKLRKLHVLYPDPILTVPRYVLFLESSRRVFVV